MSKDKPKDSVKNKALAVAATILLLLIGVIEAQAIQISSFGSAGQAGSYHGLPLGIGAEGVVFELDAFVALAGTDLNGGQGMSAQLSRDTLPAGLDYSFAYALSGDATDLTLTYRFKNNSAGILTRAVFLSFLDTEIAELRNTFFNEYGEVIGPAGTGAVDADPDLWEIDEPGFNNGSLGTSLEAGSLRNLNAIIFPGTDDVAMAIGFEIGDLRPRDEVMVEILISEDGERLGNFSLVQREPDSAVNITLSGQATYIPGNLPPVAVCRDAVLALDGNGLATLSVAAVDGGSHDPEAGPLSMTIDWTDFSCSDLGGQVVTLTVVDDFGASSSCISNVSIVDVEPPSLTLLAAKPQEISCAGSYQELGATAYDNCGGNVTGRLVIDASQVNTAKPGSYSVNYSVSDASGNTREATRQVTVIDNTPPTLTLTGANPQRLECPAAYAEQGVVAQDSCAGNLSGKVTIDTGNLDIAKPGSYTVTYRVNDDAGNMGQIDRTVIVQDTSPPQLSLLGSSPQTLECPQAYTEAGATAVDACSGDLNAKITIDASRINPGAPGSYSVNYSVSDTTGNTSRQSRQVSVQDTQPPVITLTGDKVQEMSCSTDYPELGAKAVDACYGDLTANLIIDRDQVSTLLPGEYQVTYDVKDAAGNTARQEVRTVSVLPIAAIEPPVLSYQFGQGELNKPSSVAIFEDEEETLAYVTDENDNQVVVYKLYDTHAELVEKITPQGTSLNKPAGVALPARDYLVVTDSNRKRVLFLDAINKAYQEVASEANWNTPTGVAIDPDEAIYVTDRTMKRVVKLHSDGSFDAEGTARFASLGLLEPYGITVDQDGAIYVADRNNNRIVKADDFGALLLNFGQDRLNKPMDVEVSSCGPILVADCNNNAIVVYDNEGEYQYTFGEGMFNKPQHVVLFQAGTRLITVDRNNNQLAVWTIPPYSEP